MSRTLKLTYKIYFKLSTWLECNNGRDICKISGNPIFYVSYGKVVIIHRAIFMAKNHRKKDYNALKSL